MNRLLYFLGLPLLFSCTSQVSYVVNHEPLTLPMANNRTVVIDRLKKGSVKFEKEKSQVAFQNAYNQFYAELLYQINEERQVLVVGDTLMPPILQENFNYADGLSRRILEGIHARFRADLYLVVTDYNIDVSHWMTSVDEGSREGTTIEVNALFDFYDFLGNRIDRIPIKRFLDVDRGTYVTFIDGLAGPSLKKFTDEIFVISQEVIFDLRDRFRPRQENVTQQIFVTGPFKSLDELIMQKNFQAARELLIPHTNSSSIATRKKAFHNLFVLSQLEGKYEEAEEWKRKETYLQEL